MGIEYVGGRIGTWAGATSGNQSLSLSGLSGGSDTQARAGDIVIAAYAIGANTAVSPSISDGTADYTPIGSDLYSDSTYDTNLRVAYKVMGPSPDASVTFGPTSNATFAGAAAVHVWRGVNPASPLDVAASTATGMGTTRPDPPAITPVTSGAVVIAVGAGCTASGATYTSALSHFLTANSNDNFDAALGIGSVAWTSGAVDPAQFGGGATTSGMTWAALTLALQPAPPPITGDAAITLGAVSLASAAMLPISGAAAVTLGPVVLASAGSLPISGVAAPTLDAIVLTAQGYDAVSVDGEASITLGPVGLASAAVLPIHGAAGIALGPITLTSVLKPIVIATPPPARTITFGTPTAYVPPEYDFEHGFTPAEAWSEGAVRDCIAWGEIVIAVSGLAGGDSIALQCSLDGETWFPMAGVAHGNLACTATIAADGTYEFPAGALLRWGRTGSASEPLVMVGARAWFATDAISPPLSRSLSFPAARAAARVLTLRD